MKNKNRSIPFIILFSPSQQTFNSHKLARHRPTLPLTLGVDNLIDLMRVVGILGIVLHHLEAHGQVVEGAAEIGFPSRLVVGELADLTAGYGPGLAAAERTPSQKRKRHMGH